MSMIEIKKIGITKLDTDAIVNAANEGLWEGGGVCGVIFREAGSAELEVRIRQDIFSVIRFMMKRCRRSWMMDRR